MHREFNKIIASLQDSDTANLVFRRQIVKSFVFIKGYRRLTPLLSVIILVLKMVGYASLTHPTNKLGKNYDYFCH
jgi:hypothetical protein